MPRGRKPSPLVSRLHVCHFRGLCPALPPAAASVSETFRENSCKMSWKEALLFALPWSCRPEPGQTSIGRKCTSSSTSCPRPLCTARNRHGNTERANKCQCLPFQRMPHPVSKYTSPSISSAAIRYSTSDMPPTLARPSCSHTLNKAEQNPISTKKITYERLKRTTPFPAPYPPFLPSLPFPFPASHPPIPSRCHPFVHYDLPRSHPMPPPPLLPLARKVIDRLLDQPNL